MEGERPKKVMTITQEYLSMGFKLMPCGKENHHWWYCAKFQKGSVRDKTWVWDEKPQPTGEHRCGHHKCCKSKKAYCHRVGCVNRKPIDDLSDLKDL